MEAGIDIESGDVEAGIDIEPGDVELVLTRAGGCGSWY